MITSCPPGHVLHHTNVPDEYKCKCNIENDQKIISCMQNESKIILKVCMYVCMYVYVHVCEYVCVCSCVCNVSHAITPLV